MISIFTWVYTMFISILVFMVWLLRRDLLSRLLADYLIDRIVSFFLFLSSSICSVLSSVPLIVHSNHGRSPPSGGLPVHRHSRGHRCAAVPPGPRWNLPLWCALLEEAYHQTQGMSTLLFTPVVWFVRLCLAIMNTPVCGSCLCLILISIAHSFSEEMWLSIKVIFDM